MKSALLVGLAALGGTMLALYLDRSLMDRVSTPFRLERPVVVETVQDRGPATGLDFRAASRKLLPSVVSIDVVRNVRSWFGPQQVGGSGSGVIYTADGYIVTNAHVIGDAGAQVTIHLNDGRSYPAQVIGADRPSDLAVLKINADRLTPAKFGRSDRLEVGQWVLAVGNPLGQDQTVSVGVVSNLGRDLPTNEDGVILNAIQTDAAINPGNSGGALANSNGEVIGINTAILSTRDQGSIGIGFAIPIDRALPLVEELRKEGRVRYGFLGVSFDRNMLITRSEWGRRSYFQELGSEPPAEGLMVARVAPGSPASRAGLQNYDILLELDGKKLDERIDITKVLMQKKPGQRVELKWWSRGQNRAATVLLTELGRT